MVESLINLNLLRLRTIRLARRVNLQLNGDGKRLSIAVGTNRVERNKQDIHSRTILHPWFLPVAGDNLQLIPMNFHVHFLFIHPLSRIASICAMVETMAFPSEAFSKDHSAGDPFFVKETLEETLASLIETSKTPIGQSSFASKNIISYLLITSKNLAEKYSTSPSHHLIAAFRILRNLCAGESTNITTFLNLFGVESLISIFQSVNFDPKIIQVGLQILANVVLTESTYHSEVWRQFYPLGFVEVSQVHIREVSDLVSRLLFELCKDDAIRLEELKTNDGVLIIADVIQTALIEDFAEDHLLWLLSKLCYEGTFFRRLFSKLCPTDAHVLHGNHELEGTRFTRVQGFLLSLLSKIHEEHVCDDFAFSIYQILKNASSIVHSSFGNEIYFQTNSLAVEVLESSLIILRDISTCVESDEEMAHPSALDSLLYSGLLNFVLDSLRKLEPPELIRKSRVGDLSQGKIPCPYKGYRGDLIVLIANCTFRRKEVQDEIRRQNGIVLLLEQCVIDEGNPFSREKALWAIRNLLEGNDDNQREVAELEIQGSVNLPEADELGLRVEVDPVTRLAKLVNVSSSTSK